MLNFHRVKCYYYINISVTLQLYIYIYIYILYIELQKKKTFTAKKNIFCISTNMSCAYLVYKQFLNMIFM